MAPRNRKTAGKELLRSLATSVQCETCGRNYEENSVSVMGGCAEMWLVEIDCDVCGSGKMFAVILNEKYISGFAEFST